MKPAAPVSGVSRRLQRGTAAVELAALLSATIVLIPAVALFARVFYQYSVMKEATRDAASYMASLSPAALIDSAERARAIQIAIGIVDIAAAGAGMDGTTAVGLPLVLCDHALCDNETPETIDVVVTFTIDDSGFSALTGQWTDDLSKKWKVIANSTVPLTK